MQTKPITKISQEITRDNGSQVKIVASLMTGRGLKQSTDVFVLHRDRPEDDWNLCDNRPNPDFKTMPRELYIKHGRSEMLQKVTHAEILKLTSYLGKPINSISLHQ